MSITTPGPICCSEVCLAKNRIIPAGEDSYSMGPGVFAFNWHLKCYDHLFKKPEVDGFQLVRRPAETFVYTPERFSVILSLSVKCPALSLLGTTTLSRLTFVVDLIKKGDERSAEEEELYNTLKSNNFI